MLIQGEGQSGGKSRGGADDGIRPGWQDALWSDHRGGGEGGIQLEECLVEGAPARSRGVLGQQLGQQGRTATKAFEERLTVWGHGAMQVSIRPGG